ncbi:MAG: sigma-70 family RNA polymerase sigma factor [Planctomycetales bacterium]|nr:sigma-70 family RNA polymerase sigma factor [Planctomycetales bacterium]
MALSETDRRLLQRCLAGDARSWEEFVDRFLGLVVHVVDHTAHGRGVALGAEDREDHVADVFLAIVRDDFGVLRRFRGESSLATYLTVIARRAVLHRMSQPTQSATLSAYRQASQDPGQDRIGDQEEVERLLAHLEGAEADVVRMYHLQGKSYREISSAVGIPENSIGPTLSRARNKLREASL